MKELFCNMAHSAAQSGQVAEMRRREPRRPRLMPVFEEEGRGGRDLPQETR